MNLTCRKVRRFSGQKEYKFLQFVVVNGSPVALAEDDCGVVQQIDVHNLQFVKEKKVDLSVLYGTDVYD